MRHNDESGNLEMYDIPVGSKGGFVKVANFLMTVDQHSEPTEKLQEVPEDPLKRKEDPLKTLRKSKECKI